MNDKQTRVAKALASGEWTVSALHDHIETVLYLMEQRNQDRFASQERTTAAALKAAAKAVEKAERLADIRAASQNEWRGTVSDIIAQGKGSREQTDTLVPWLIAGAGVIVAAISIVINFTH